MNDDLECEFNIKPQDEENVEEKIQLTFPFLILSESKIKLSTQANDFLNENHIEELNFISVLGPKKSGKSLFLNLLLEFESHFISGPWRKTLHPEINKTTNEMKKSYDNFHRGSKIGRLLYKENSSIIAEIFKHSTDDRTLVDMFVVKDAFKINCYLEAIFDLDENEELYLFLFMLLFKISNVFVLNYKFSNVEELGIDNKNSSLLNYNYSQSQSNNILNQLFKIKEYFMSKSQVFEDYKTNFYILLRDYTSNISLKNSSIKEIFNTANVILLCHPFSNLEKINTGICYENRKSLFPNAQIKTIINDNEGLDKETLNKEFKSSFNELKKSIIPFISSKLNYKFKLVSSLRLNSSNFLELLNFYFINQEVPAFSNFWLSLIQNNLHIYHDKAMQLFYQDLNISSLTPNFITNFNYNTLINNYNSFLLNETQVIDNNKENLFLGVHLMTRNYATNEEADENCIFEDYILVERIKNAREHCLKNYEVIILNDVFSSYKNFEEIYIIAKTDIVEELKRIENKLLFNNSKKLTQMNLSLLNSIYSSMNGNEQFINVEDNEFSSSELKFDYKNSLIVFLKDYETVCIGKNKIKDLIGFLFNGMKTTSNNKRVIFNTKYKFKSLLSQLFVQDQVKLQHLLDLKKEIIDKNKIVEDNLHYIKSSAEKIKAFDLKSQELESLRLKKIEEIQNLKKKLYNMKEHLGFSTERNFNCLPNTFQRDDRNFETLITEDRVKNNCSCGGGSSPCNIF